MMQDRSIDYVVVPNALTLALSRSKPDFGLQIVIRQMIQRGVKFLPPIESILPATRNDKYKEDDGDGLYASKDWRPHGTMVASVAGGNKFGVASRANLILIKAAQASKLGFTADDPGPYRLKPMTDVAIAWAFEHILQDVIANGRQRRLVLNLSLRKFIEL